jgi:DNA polymerase-3 subunit gamma/tau
MGKALYRKYRSKKLSEVVGQEHVTTALANALKNGTIGHAYLFTGPRGVGKTSVARILAHEVNQLPYDENATHLDIIEIDAASNRRIDEIRTLRERVHNAPTSAKYKVYIIDEVHMLTKEAFNALLKTLEEPPAHVIFILATTEVHKLPETIISRTQRFSFKPADQASAVAHLRSIADQEKINITDAALALVAEQGRGSFRDSISTLDQIRNAHDKIDVEHVQRLLGIAPAEAIDQLLQTTARHDASAVIAQLQALLEQGFQATHIAKQLGSHVRSQVIRSSSILPPLQATRLMERLIDVPSSHDPYTLLEIVLLDIVLADSAAVVSVPQPITPPAQPPAAQPKPKKSAPAAPVSEQQAQVDPDTQPIPKPAPVSTTAPSESTALNEESWQRILMTLKQQHNTLYGIARMAVPLFDGDKLTLSFSFPFHQKRFNDAKTKLILSEIIIQETGITAEIICVVDGSKSPKPVPGAPKQAKATESLDTISNIFGGAEVLE